jgi:hypothetical protein
MKDSVFTKRNDALRSEIQTFIEQHCPDFKYKGHAVHVGLWETSTDVDKLLELTKPNGDAERAAFRLLVHFPNEHGIPIHIEFYPAPYWEWETVFNGYIANVRDLVRIFGFQLGIKLQNLFQRDSIGCIICPHSKPLKRTKARCVGCAIAGGCEYKDLILFDYGTSIS